MIEELSAVEWFEYQILKSNHAVLYNDEKFVLKITIEDLRRFKDQAKERENNALLEKYGEGYDEGVYDGLNK